MNKRCRTEELSSMVVFKQSEIAKKCQGRTCETLTYYPYCSVCYKKLRETHSPQQILELKTKSFDYYVVAYGEDPTLGIVKTAFMESKGKFIDGLGGLDENWDTFDITETPLAIHVDNYVLTYADCLLISQHPICNYVGMRWCIMQIDKFISVETRNKLQEKYAIRRLCPPRKMKPLTFAEIVELLSSLPQTYQKKMIANGNFQLNTNLVEPTLLRSSRKQQWDNVRPICMSCLEPSFEDLHLCSEFTHILCTECFVTVLHSKIPNTKAVKCLESCNGIFTIQYVKYALKPQWLSNFEYSMINSLIPLAYCYECKLPSEKDCSNPNHICGYCSRVTCGHCFGKYTEEHKCEMLLVNHENANKGSTDIILKCANEKCGLIGIVEQEFCMKIFCIGCGTYTCACCFQSLGRSKDDYAHFCRCFKEDTVCYSKTCKHCYCWPTRTVALGATPDFLRTHPHLDYRSGSNKHGM